MNKKDKMQLIKKINIKIEIINQTIKYLKKLYKKEQKQKIEIKIIDLKFKKTNDFIVDFICESQNKNVYFKKIDRLFLNLEEIGYFDDKFNWTKF